MNEAQIRKWHRSAGLILAVFILLQVVTGIALSVENLLGKYWAGILHDSHEGWGGTGGIYRIILGTGLLWMVATGGMIAMKVRDRLKKR